MTKVLTLAIVHNDSRILLGMKKRGFGSGRWNGFGGKVEEGESIEEAACREVAEESSIKVVNLEKIGILHFEFENDPKILETHVFKIRDYSGEPSETEEMVPRWFDASEIPFEKMWPDDIYWLPIFLSNKKFKGRFLFDRPSDEKYTSKIIEKELFEVVNFD